MKAKFNQVPFCTQYTEPGATALDDVDGDITGDIVTSGLGNIDVSSPGIYTVWFEVSDSAGNFSKKKRNVQVLSSEDKQEVGSSFFFFFFLSIDTLLTWNSR